MSRRNHKRRRSLAANIAAFALTALALVLPRQAAAQVGSGEVDLGPVALTPTLSISSFGVDNNVFNDPTQPRQDVTATVTPQVDFGVPLGRVRWTGTTLWNLRYYQQYRDQGGLSTSNQMKLEIVSARIAPYALGSFQKTYDRTALDVDARLHQTAYSVAAGALVRLTGKTSLDVSADQTGTSFDAADVVRDLSVRDQLNRAERRVTATGRYELTPLSTLTVTADQQWTHFQFSPERDSSGLRLMAGADLKPFALISGSVRVGLLRFSPTDPRQPGFVGPIASIDLGYTLLGATRFTAKIMRDLAYSVDDLETYYLQTGVAGSVIRQLNERWDVAVNAERQRLGARLISPDAAAADAPLIPLLGAQTVRQYGVSVGYRFTRGVRLGLNAIAVTRSGIPTEEYTDVRIFGSAVYRLK